MGQALELLESQRAVVDCRLHTEAVFHQVLLARQVAAVHRTYLRYSHMALVDYGKIVFREIIEQAEGTHPGFAAVEIAAVILDAGTVAYLANHLDVVRCAGFKAVGLKGFTLGVEITDLLAEVNLHLRQGGGLSFARGHEKVRRVNLEAVVLAQRSIVQGVQCGNSVDFVAPEFHAQNNLLVCQAYVDCIALHAECTTRQFDFVA